MFQPRTLGGRPTGALSACWHPPADCFACSRHVSSQCIERFAWDPLVGKSISVCPLLTSILILSPPNLNLGVESL